MGSTTSHTKLLLSGFSIKGVESLFKAFKGMELKANFAPPFLPTKEIALLLLIVMLGMYGKSYTIEIIIFRRGYRRALITDVDYSS
jgi:hypothetical protein